MIGAPDFDFFFFFHCKFIRCSQILFFFTYTNSSASLDSIKTVEDGEIDFDSDVMEIEISPNESLENNDFDTTLQKNKNKKQKIKRKNRKQRKVSFFNNACCTNKQ